MIPDGSEGLQWRTNVSAEKLDPCCGEALRRATAAQCGREKTRLGAIWITTWTPIARTQTYCDQSLLTLIVSTAQPTPSNCHDGAYRQIWKGQEDALGSSRCRHGKSAVPSTRPDPAKLDYTGEDGRTEVGDKRGTEAKARAGLHRLELTDGI